MRSVQAASFSDCESSQFEHDTLVLPAKTGLRRFFTKKVAAAVSVGAVLLLAPAAVHLARPGAHPGCQPVAASHEGVDDEAYVFEQPFHNWVGHRDVPVYALFEAHLGCPHDASDNPNADFDAFRC